MSTRCNIHFNHGRSVHANIYRHSDGYPGKIENGEPVEYGVLQDLLEFFRLLKAEVRDTRFGQAEYLAAKFLVWQSQKLVKYETYGELENGEWGYDESKEHPLQFLGVSPCTQDHGDIEFIYEINCDKLDSNGFPQVRWKAVAWEPPTYETRARTKFSKPVDFGRVRVKAA